MKVSSKRLIASIAVPVALLIVFALPQGAYADTLQGVNLNQVQGTTSIGSACSVGLTARSGCSTSSSIASGLPFLTICNATNVYVAGGQQSGLCIIDKGQTGQAGTSAVTVSADVCRTPTPGNPTTTGFTITSSGTPTIIFHDVASTAWTVTSFRIQTTGFAHAGQLDNWALVPGDAVTGNGSKFVATNAGRTLTMWLNGNVYSTSDCEHGVPTANFAFDDIAGNGTITG